MAVLAGCGSGAGAPRPDAAATGTADPAAGGGISQADDLQVHVDRGDGTPADTWTLTCAGAVEGTHPDADAACAHLRAMDEPFAPLPGDIACTEQYGGPQTAHVTGRWGGRSVDLALSRTDGCRIAQWDGLGPLLPVPVGAEPIG
jgi:hypothetical protein